MSSRSSRSSSSSSKSSSSSSSRSSFNTGSDDSEWYVTYRKIPKKQSKSVGFLAYAAGAPRNSNIVKKKTRETLDTRSMRSQRTYVPEVDTQLFWVTRTQGKSSRSSSGGSPGFRPVPLNGPFTHGAMPAHMGGVPGGVPGAIPRPGAIPVPRGGAHAGAPAGAPPFMNPGAGAPGFSNGPAVPPGGFRPPPGAAGPPPPQA